MNNHHILHIIFFGLGLYQVLFPVSAAALLLDFVVSFGGHLAKITLSITKSTTFSRSYLMTCCAWEACSFLANPPRCSTLLSEFIPFQETLGLAHVGKIEPQAEGALLQPIPSFPWALPKVDDDPEALHLRAPEP